MDGSSVMSQSSSAPFASWPSNLPCSSGASPSCSVSWSSLICDSSCSSSLGAVCGFRCGRQRPSPCAPHTAVRKLTVLCMALADSPSDSRGLTAQSSLRPSRCASQTARRNLRSPGKASAGLQPSQGSSPPTCMPPSACTSHTAMRCLKILCMASADVRLTLMAQLHEACHCHSQSSTEVTGICKDLKP